LAGLLEFPTLEDITQTLTEAELVELARKCFSGMLGTEIYSCDDSEAETGGREEELQQLRMISTRSLGGILHIFSHIRKTYRVCMITLEGGEDPPSLNFEERQKMSNGNRRKTGDGEENKASAATKSLWIASEEVAASK
jgi:hypothetical protein